MLRKMNYKASYPDIIQQKKNQGEYGSRSESSKKEFLDTKNGLR